MILKFRTMKINAETRVHEGYFERLMQADCPMTKLDRGDARLIRGGRSIRALGLDELPQLFNVLRGEMSLVGPRPCTPHEFERYQPAQRHRVNAPPGLTGYWQVNGKNKTTFSQMIEMDIFYTKNMSLKMDLVIILRTLPAIAVQVLESRTVRAKGSRIKTILKERLVTLRRKRIVWRDHGSATLAVLAALATGSLVGVINGVIYVKGRLPHPFIPTLAMLSAASGLALLLSHNETIQGAPPIVNTIGTGRISWIPGGGEIGWFPVATLVVLGVALLVTLVTRGLVWGRWIYAVGGNPEAAVRTGIPVGSVLISVYVVCGLLAGVAALLMMGKGNAGSPTSGALAELDAIAAVIIGGASFLGGRGTVLNAITGALVIAVMRNGLNLLGIEPSWQYMATGAVIVIAVELDVVRGRLESRFRSLQAVSGP